MLNIECDKYAVVLLLPTTLFWLNSSLLFTNTFSISPFFTVQQYITYLPNFAYIILWYYRDSGCTTLLQKPLRPHTLRNTLQGLELNDEWIHIHIIHFRVRKELKSEVPWGLGFITVPGWHITSAENYLTLWMSEWWFYLIRPDERFIELLYRGGGKWKIQHWKLKKSNIENSEILKIENWKKIQNIKIHKSWVGREERRNWH